MNVNTTTCQPAPSPDVINAMESNCSDQPVVVQLVSKINATDSSSKSSFTWSSEFVQLLLSLLIAGSGSVFTGYLLNYTANELTVFQRFPQLIIVVPALLGLKGNVEMTLASRLSTYANLNHLNDNHFRSFFVGNTHLVQFQATAIGLLASVVTLGISCVLSAHPAANTPVWHPNTTGHQSGPDDCIKCDSNVCLATILVTSCVFTVSIASLILCLLIFAMVLACKYNQCDPDNVAVPLAASVGDFVTLLLYVTCCNFVYDLIAFDHIQKVQFNLIAIWTVLAAFLITLLPISALFALKSKHTSRLMYNGWYSIVSGMALQTLGGLIMESALQYHRWIPLFQPILNGIGGNLVAIQCTRMSTHLHKHAIKRQLPHEQQQIVPKSPFHLFQRCASPHLRLYRLLVVLSVCCHLFLLYMIHLLPNKFQFTTHFVLVFMSTELIQLIILMYLAHILVHVQWLSGINPDNNAIPFMTALADLLGSALLAGLFLLLKSTHHMF